VTENSVLPGPTWSEGVAEMVKGHPREAVTKEFFENVRPTSIIKRFIEPDEVAAIVAYVCSPLAAATTGAALRVEGGCVQSI
jgi:NAD(P)-dependent dehydrogenase (short-subunit alcohol dehydrogenase family)